MKLAALLLALLLLAPQSIAQDTPQDTPVEPVADVTEETVASDDIVSALDAAGNFTILVKALRDTGLDTALSGTETFTVFAPTDEAFQKLPEGTLESLTADDLVGILRHHVLIGAVNSTDAATLDTAPTVEGGELAIATTEEGLTVGGANVTEADIETSNGIVHVIDTVLLPSPADAALEGQAAGGQASDTLEDAEGHLEDAAQNLEEAKEDLEDAKEEIKDEKQKEKKQDEEGQDDSELSPENTN